MRRSYIREEVLRQLKQKPHSGYELMKAIGGSTGIMPSSGSIYPILKKMLEGQLVTVSRQERKRVYSLTRQGQEIAKDVSSSIESDILELQRLAMGPIVRKMTAPEKKSVQKKVRSILMELRRSAG